MVRRSFPNTNVAGSSIAWGLDAQGNWGTVTTDGTTQTRSTDDQNELNTLTTGTNVTTLSYDYNGNLTHDEYGHYLIYDPWNRLVEVDDSGHSALVTYSYDAQSRGAFSVHYSAFAFRDMYFSQDWQVIEEDDELWGVYAENVYGIGYVDDLVERDRDTNNDGVPDERLWAQQDANHNVTSIVDTSGNVAERFVYSPYGEFTVVNATTWASASDTKDWVATYQGLRYDGVVKDYDSRTRRYDPSLGRFKQQDGTEWIYVDGANLFQFLSGDPIGHLDPFGLCTKGDKRSLGYEVTVLPYNMDPAAAERQQLLVDLAGDVEILEKIAVVVESAGAGAEGFTEGLLEAIRKALGSLGGKSGAIFTKADGKSIAENALRIGNLASGKFGGYNLWTRVVYEKCVCQGSFGGLGWKRYVGPWRKHESGGIDGEGLFQDLADALRAAGEAGTQTQKKFDDKFNLNSMQRRIWFLF